MAHKLTREDIDLYGGCPECARYLCPGADGWVHVPGGHGYYKPEVLLHVLEHRRRMVAGLEQLWKAVESCPVNGGYKAAARFFRGCEKANRLMGLNNSCTNKLWACALILKGHLGGDWRDRRAGWQIEDTKRCIPGLLHTLKRDVERWTQDRGLVARAA